MAGRKANRSAPTPEEYNDIVGLADLVDIKLVKSSFNIEPAYFGLDPMQRDLLQGCELALKHFNDEPPRILMGFYDCEAGCKQSRKWLLKVKATFLVVYHVRGNPTEAAASEFLDRVGRFACFPYFRGHVAQLAASAGAELPPLPVLKGNLPRRISEPDEQVEAKKLPAKR